jgi:putative transposase
MKPAYPKRKHPAKGVISITGQPTIVFDTVCTKDQEPWLASDEVHALLRTLWQEADAWLLGRYIIMPDHIHFFAGATRSDIEYDNWVQYWKSQFSKRHKNRAHRWLTGNWDTRMRTAAAHEEKWEYVRWNAVRHGLVPNSEDWPYQGQIHELPWD